MAQDDFYDGMSSAEYLAAIKKRNGRSTKVKNEEPAISESELQATLIDLFVMDGWVVIRVNGGALQTDESYVPFFTWQALGFPARGDGVSDLIVLKNGRGILVECKKPGGKPQLRPGQVAFKDAADQCEASHIVASSVDDIVHLLDRVEIQ